MLNSPCVIFSPLMMSEIRSVISTTDNSEALNLIKQRNSAFAAVLKTNFQKAENAAAEKQPTIPAHAVEVRKRTLEMEPVESHIEPKKAKIDKPEAYVMRLPPSAQSGLCHQRAKETIEQQRKLSDPKQKRFK